MKLSFKAFSFILFLIGLFFIRIFFGVLYNFPIILYWIYFIYFNCIYLLVYDYLFNDKIVSRRSKIFLVGGIIFITFSFVMILVSKEDSDQIKYNRHVKDSRLFKPWPPVWTSIDP